MPRPRKQGPPAGPAFDPAALDALLGERRTMDEVDELFRQMKKVLTEDGAIPLAIPRDRAGTFAPQLVPKNARRLPKFDETVLSLYARGMSVREIQEHLEQLYQVEVAPSFISAVTDEVLEEVTAWQQRPLERCYPVVMFDALRVKIRDEGVVRNKAV